LEHSVKQRQSEAIIPADLLELLVLLCIITMHNTQRQSCYSTPVSRPTSHLSLRCGHKKTIKLDKVLVPFFWQSYWQFSQLF